MPRAHSRKPPYSRVAERFFASAAGASCPTGSVLHVAVGLHAWGFARGCLEQEPVLPAVCIPPGEDPSQFDWSLIIGRCVWLYPGEEMSEADTQAIALCLLLAGAQRIDATLIAGNWLETVVYTAKNRAE